MTTLYAVLGVAKDADGPSIKRVRMQLHAAAEYGAPPPPHSIRVGVAGILESCAQDASRQVHQ
eukprot:scaffold1586_cov116-Isochrysis_galbana.AAC.4